MTTTEQNDAVSLADRIQRAIENDEIQLPPLPELAIKLRRLLADQDRADAKLVAELVQNDTAVSVSLLRFANSAAFRGLHQISDLNQAIARLGLTRVGSLVTALKVEPQFGSNCPEKDEILRGLWDHSVAAAQFSRRLAEREGEDAEEAFLAGLLHDCGRLLVLKGVDHLEESDGSLEVTRPVLDELMELLHTKLGHHTLSSWNLPEPLCEIALRHEDTANEGDPRLLTIVQAADLLSRKLGKHPNPDPDLNLLDEESIDLLGLRDIELASLMVELEDDFNQIRSLF